MKTKLLRRIRKQYQIFYYPERETKYEVRDDREGSMIPYSVYATRVDMHKTLQDAKDEILRRIKDRYFEHSKAYKLRQIKKKVWYGQQ